MREVGAELGGAVVAGSREDSRVGEVALRRPAERVLAAASPEDQDSHVFLLNASVNAWAARLAVSTTSFTTAFASFMQWSRASSMALSIGRCSASGPRRVYSPRSTRS